MTPTRRALASFGRGLDRVLRGFSRRPVSDPVAAELVARAAAELRAGQREAAQTLYRQALDIDRNDVPALRGLREITMQQGAWRDALALQQRIVGLVAAADRAGEQEWLAVIEYQLGRVDLDRGQPAAALVHLKNATRADQRFIPAALALGDTHEAMGDGREAVRAWERALEAEPSLPILSRLERAYRREGRPSRMIALYRTALERAPDDLGIAAALGRVYFDLEMLDEAADQLEKVEVRAPDVPAVHAFLGAIFEHRGQTREAFEEYRRALRLADGFEWPQRCRACGGVAQVWQERCPLCGHWNALRSITGSR